jgi:hypothetical protein
MNQNVFLREILKLKIRIIINSTNFIEYTGSYLVFKYGLTVFYLII